MFGHFIQQKYNEIRSYQTWALKTFTPFRWPRNISSSCSHAVNAEPELTSQLMSLLIQKWVNYTFTSYN